MCELHDIWSIFSSCFVVQTNGYQSVFILFLICVLRKMVHLCRIEHQKPVGFVLSMDSLCEIGRCVKLKKRAVKLWEERGTGEITLP